MAGTSLAYWLTRAGAAVSLYEPSGIGSHASGFAFGTLPPSTFGNQYAGPLAVRAREEHVALAGRLREESGVDHHFTDAKPYVELAFGDGRKAEVEAKLRSAAAERPAHPRERVEWLDAEQLRADEPRIGGGLAGGCVYHGTFQLSALELTRALWAAAERRGGVLARVEVARLARDPGDAARVVGVEHAGGVERADMVVLANGVRITRFLNLPVAPIQGEILQLESDQPPLRRIYFWGKNDYVASKADGAIFAGTTEELKPDGPAPTAAARAKIERSLAGAFPYLAGATLKRHTACLRPVSPDMLPLAGTIEGAPGLAVFGGAGRDGILQSPLVGRILADLLLEGRRDPLLAALDPLRFGGGG